MNICFGDMPNEQDYDWVMFTHGTYFAFFREPASVDIEKKGLDLLRKWGEVQIGM
jgi:hypothetical protein